MTLALLLLLYAVLATVFMGCVSGVFDDTPDFRNPWMWAAVVFWPFFLASVVVCSLFRMVFWASFGAARIITTQIQKRFP